MKTITAEELKTKIDARDDFILVDVLSDESFKESHIVGSLSIPVAEDTFDSMVAEKLTDKNKPVIVYCASQMCQASPRAAKKLEEMGYTDVTDFEGGLEDWEKAGFEFV